MAMAKSKLYGVSFFCDYDRENRTRHYQVMPLKDIPKWLEAYKFTHPEVRAISVKIWMDSREGDEE